MKFIKLLFVLILLTSASTSVYAATGRHHDEDEHSNNLYVGLSMGSMITDIPNAKNSAPSLSSPFASSIFMGADFSQNLAAELTYTNLGITDVGGSTNLKGSAYSLNIVGILPATDALSMFARLGIADTGAYFETATGPGGTQTLIAPTFGLGIMVNISSRVDGRLSYDNFKFSTNNGNTYNANIITLTAVFHL
jgi:opacity protein-like surface antigen